MNQEPQHPDPTDKKDDSSSSSSNSSDSNKNAAGVVYDTETVYGHDSSTVVDDDNDDDVDDNAVVVVGGAAGGDDDDDDDNNLTTTTMLDACMRDLTRRRMQQQAMMAQQHRSGQDEQQAATTIMLTGGGGVGEQRFFGYNITGRNGGGQFAAPDQRIITQQAGDVEGEEASSRNSIIDRLEHEQNLLKQMIMMNKNSGVGGLDRVGGDSSTATTRRGSTSGLADYVGPTADSFAQAFVDRWASSHLAATTTASSSSSQPPQMNNAYHHRTTTTTSPEIGSKRNHDLDSSIMTSSVGGVGGGGGENGSGMGSHNKLWWVCDYCQEKAFMTRDELHLHVICCELNPTLQAGSRARSGSGHSRHVESGESMMVPLNSNNGSRMLGNGWNTGGGIGFGGGQMSSSLHSMHSYEPLVRSTAAGSINSSHPSLGDHSILHPAVTGYLHHNHHHHPQQQQHPHLMGSRTVAAAALQNAWLSTSVNHYNMGTICNDGSMMMNPHNILHGMGGGTGMSYAPQPDGMSSMGNINHNPTEIIASQKKKTMPINPELLEASKGPFRQLSKPIPLALDEDKHWITPLHCFVRKHCVEVFTASDMEVQTPSKGKRKPIQVGQIGIRCVHCHEGLKDTDLNRERGSVYYPTSLSSIYNATMNLLQRHLRTCPKVPDSIMEKYKELKDDDARSGTSKAYWIESARSLGFVDTLHGIKLSAEEPPPPPSTSVSQNQTKEAMRCSDERISMDRNVGESEEGRDLDDGVDATKETDEGTKEGEDGAKDTGVKDVATNQTEAVNGKIKKERVEEESRADPTSLVDPSDKDTATEFSYFLLQQMRACVFTEADRLGKRKGLPPGFAGLACRHCFGGYGSGRYFPSSIKTISDTSKTLNVLYNHMTRCRGVPKDVLDQLEIARAKHDDERGKKKFGSQKAFFAKVWSRLHDNRLDGAVNTPPSRKPLKSSVNDGVRRLSSTQSASSIGSCQSEVMPSHSGMGDVVKPSQAAMSARDMAMALVMGGGEGYGMGCIPHGTMQYPINLGGSFDPKIMTRMDGGNPTSFLSVGEALPAPMIGGECGADANLSMGGSNHGFLASFQHVSQQLGNGMNGDKKRSLDKLISSEDGMSEKKMRLLSSTNTADV